MDYGFNIALNMYRNLTGDYDTVFDTTEDIYTEIDKNFDSGDGLVNVESLDVNITDNGTYTYEKTLEIDGYNPVRVNVELDTETYYQNGYNDGYGVGEGVGYGNGVTAGKDEQKALLEETTFNDNGVYEKEDGWKRVSVEVDIPTFETETLSVELTDNGNYSYTPTKDGFGSVDVTVNVPTGGGGDSGDVIDFTQIGWSAADNKRIVDRFKADFEYTQSVAHKIDGKTSLSYVFRDDKDLVYAPMGDTSNVTNMTSMFEDCSSLKEVPLYDTSKVTHMSNMFSGCSSLTEIPLLDTSKVTNMGLTFSGCSSLTEIPLLDISNVWDMSNMFSGCSSLTEIPLLDTSKVTAMDGVFTGCSSLTEIPLLDTSKVTVMNYTFRDCSSLTEIPLLDTSKVTSMDYIFYNCKNLTTIPELDCSSLARANIFGYNTLTTLVNLGGFKNLGMQSSMSSNLNSYFLQSSKNVTYESLMNIINKLYDRKSAGYSVITLKFGTDNLAKLTDEEKAIATNKGWTLS